MFTMRLSESRERFIWVEFVNTQKQKIEIQLSMYIYSDKGLCFSQSERAFYANAL